MDVEIKNLTYSVGGLELYRNFNFFIPEGRVTAITGPSGCGKTTILRLLSGLEEAGEGQICGLSQSSRISFVFQEDRLLPWLTLRKNLELVLPDDWGEGEKRNRVDGILSRLELSDFGEYLPENLSGGMQRRAAVGRALLFPGDLFLLDEPFKGLDQALKENVIELLKSQWKEHKTTALLVTHHREDAELLADCLWEFKGRPVESRLVFG